jgi:DNA-binding LytR/AlgR family response regulator
MRVLIVDDEPIALDRLENALSCMPEMVLVGRAMTGREALQLARDTSPDVILLDINMPRQDGLTVMRLLIDGGNPPEVVFITAMDQHAIRAFELHAADYLMKPVSFERLREALRRVEERLRARTAERRFAELDRVIEMLKGERPSVYDREVWVRTKSGVDRVAVDDVDVFKADGDYVAVQTKERTHLLKVSLAALHERLDPEKFARAHRSAVVNLSRVKGVRRRRPRGLSLVLEGGAQIEVGPSHADDVLARLNARRWR